MDLDLQTLTPGPSGGTPVFVRELTAEDRELSLNPPASPAQQRLKKIRDTHHALARALASGMGNAEASACTGYSIVRISILLADPAFQDLIAHYQEIVETAYADLYSRMGALSVDIIDELRERFEDGEEDSKGEMKPLSTTQLHAMLISFADRTGFGPKTTQVNVNVDLAGRLDAARRRSSIAMEVVAAPLIAADGEDLELQLEVLPRAVENEYSNAAE